MTLLPPTSKATLQGVETCIRESPASTFNGGCWDLDNMPHTAARPRGTLWKRNPQPLVACDGSVIAQTLVACYGRRTPPASLSPVMKCLEFCRRRIRKTKVRAVTLTTVSTVCDDENTWLSSCALIYRCSTPPPCSEFHAFLHFETRPSDGLRGPLGRHGRG